jgi:hypothetical protein
LINIDGLGYLLGPSEPEKTFVGHLEVTFFCYFLDDGGRSNWRRYLFRFVVFAIKFSHDNCDFFPTSQNKYSKAFISVFLN